ncbi:MAG: siderophore-interacting protein [Burkholderiaceae bacterium]|nr:siderophore-interacting protein [Rhodoferax sp.]MCP5283420.1 siderophore-interacting protein [Burkholderiaceae bacterium]
METVLSPTRRVQRVRHEIRRRDVQVARVEPLGACFVRVVFIGSALEGFTSLGFDDHLKFFCADPAGGEPARRDYTPRHWDAARQELTIDFALHGHGLASNWARQASAGQSAVIAGPRGSMIVPTDYAWHLLIGDATAAPAIGRRLAELPAEARVIVLVDLLDLAMLELDHCAVRPSVIQVQGDDALVAAVASMALPPGEGFAWAAGESSTMARVRDLLLVSKGHPREASRVAAYWKRGAADFHEELNLPASAT